MSKKLTPFPINDRLRKAWITRRKKYPRSGERMAIRGIPRLSVVSVCDVPKSKAERRLENIIRAVWRLPKGRGVKFRSDSMYSDEMSHSRSILTIAKIIGLPVTTRVRYEGKEPFIYVFKRTDVIRRRTGFETR